MGRLIYQNNIKSKRNIPRTRRRRCLDALWAIWLRNATPHLDPFLSPPLKPANPRVSGRASLLGKVLELHVALTALDVSAPVLLDASRTSNQLQTFFFSPNPDSCSTLETRPPHRRQASAAQRSQSKGHKVWVGVEDLALKRLRSEHLSPDSQDRRPG